MTAYDHLAHLYIMCTNHYGRNITSIGSELEENVRNAMFSLSTAFPLPDIQATFARIRRGGLKASGMYLHS